MLKLGPFELEELLGKGGMGEVWRGRHESQLTPVAVKVILREGSTQPAYLEAFRNEVQAMAMLDHPAIITVLDYGYISQQVSLRSQGYFVQDSPYLVMELAQYGSLERWLPKLQWPQLQAVLFTVLDALAHAHAAGVIHRDLKPQNLLLDPTLASPVKLTDFGLSHAVHEEEGRDGRFEPVWGTPNYMAPEQIRGSWRDYGPWTDLYALGCMAYELVTGQVPFVASDAAALWGAHLTQPVPAWTPRVEVPPGLERWVLRLLQKEPNKRFGRAADAAFALGVLCGVRTEQALVRAHDSLCEALSQREPPVDLRSDPLIPGPSARVDLEAPTRQDLERPTTIAVIPSLAALDWSSQAQVESIEVDLRRELKHPDRARDPWPLTRSPFPMTWRRLGAPQVNYRLLGTGLHLHRLRQLRLVDRDQERDALWELLKSAYVLGQPHLAIISGPPGVGKTRLAQWIGERAHELGAVELLQGSYSQVPSPYDGIVPMFARHAQTLSLHHKDALVRLAHYLKMHGSSDPQHFKHLSDVLLEHDQDYLHSKGLERVAVSTFQRHQTLLDHLLLLARERPLYIHLDEVHWGTEALFFVRHLMRQNEGLHLPALFVLCVRAPTLEDSPLERQLVHELQALPQAQRLELAPLPQPDFAQLVRHILPLSAALTEQVEQRAHGIPLFAIELISDWIDQGKLIDREDGYGLADEDALALPDDIHALMQAQLKRLDEPLRLPLQLAAALGTQIRAHEWLKAIKLYPLELTAAQRAQLEASSVLKPQSKQALGFAHNMMRESLMREAQEAGRWPAINWACAQMLRELYPHLGAHQERLAAHLIEAGRLEEAIEPLAQAAERRKRRIELPRAHRLLDQLQALAQRLELSPGHEALLRGELIRAACHDMQGSYDLAIQAAHAAMTRAQLYGPASIMIEATLQLGWATLHSGQTAQAEGWFEQVMALTSEQDPWRPIHREAQIALGRVAQRRGVLDLAATRFEHAMLEAQRDEHHEHRAICLNGLGDLARQAGRLDEAADYSERSLQLARTLGNRLIMADCETDLAELYRLRGQHELARDCGLRAIAIFDAIESDLRLRVHLELSFNALAQRRFEEAARHLDGLVERFRARADLGQLPLALMASCAMLAKQACWVELHESLDEAQELLDASQRRDPDVAMCAQVILAILPARGFEASRQRLMKLVQEHQLHQAP